MERYLLELKAILEILEAPVTVREFDDRKKTQKLVYLLSACGIDLGYHFGWYLYGPYSTDLTKDYFELETKTNLGIKGVLPVVPQQYITIIENLKSLIEKPESVDLKEADWLELLSSAHFLTNVSNLSQSEAERIIRQQKSHLSDFMQEAFQIADKIGRN